MEKRVKKGNEKKQLQPLDEAAKEEIKVICDVLKKGGVILYPTDTVWGIGCDATNAEAVKRIYDIKQREDSKAMLVLVDNDVKVDFYVSDVPEVAWSLIEFATKPITIIYDGARNLASNLVAADGSIGVRVTQERFSKEICYRYRKAIVSTSANISGTPSPNSFAEISDEIKKSVDYIVKYRQSETSNAKPSSIIKLGKGGEVKVIRE
ncbi:MAG: L-threonylcarbamoyladenylate synthase [Phocaeicola sp.]